MYTEQGRPRPVSGSTMFWLFLPLAGFFIYWFKVHGALNQFWESNGAQPA